MSSASLFCAVALLSAVSALPGHLTYGVPAPVTYLGEHLSSQYHAQDDFGQYAYGYNTGLSSKTEQRTLDGVTRGAYSYVDADGKLQNVHYTADPVYGFRVAATNLPEDTAVAPTPVQDTPEVAQAKTEHFAAIEEAKVRNAAAPVEVPVVKHDAPVLPATLTYKAPVLPVVPHYAFPYSVYSAYHPYHYEPLAHGYFGDYLHYARFPHFAPHVEHKTVEVAGKVGFPYA